MFYLTTHSTHFIYGYMALECVFLCTADLPHCKISTCSQAGTVPSFPEPVIALHSSAESTHSAESRKQSLSHHCEREIPPTPLFYDALNTFYLWLYGVRHMVNDHSDSEKGNPLPPHGLLFFINSKGYFICTILDRISHTMTFVTPVVEHWLISTEGSGMPTTRPKTSSPV